MIRKVTACMTAILLAAVATSAFAAEAYPSTNDANREVGQPHVNLVSVEDGAITLTFVSPTATLACFEYRIDGAATTRKDCLNNGEVTRVLDASEKVEVRYVEAYPAEPGWYFGWTAFPGEPVVDPSTDPNHRSDCMNDGWLEYEFRNQGLCIRYVNTGKDGR